jgi:hypothetical protein
VVFFLPEDFRHFWPGFKLGAMNSRAASFRSKVREENPKSSRSVSIDEKSYPDWQAKLNRGLAQLDANEGVELESFLATEKKCER